MDFKSEINIFINQLKQLESSVKKEYQEKLLKNTISFLGIDEFQIKDLLQQWYKKNNFDQLTAKDQLNIAKIFLQKEIAEVKITGGIIIQQFILKKVNFLPILSLLENLYDQEDISDWNTSDWLSTRLMTPMIEQGGQVYIKKIVSFKDSLYPYKARCAAVSMVNVRDKNIFNKEIETVLQTLVKRRDSHMMGAVSWLLREYSKDNKVFAFNFVESKLHYFDRKSILNSLKYYPKEQGKYFI